jgi:peptidyl-prolyl cis-trans isomerase C
VLRTAVLARIRGEVARAAPVDDVEVKAYFEKNAAKFHSPERYTLWLIATHQKEEADAVIAELKKDPSPKHWTELCRTRSIDGATAMRGGNLGFVSPDGTTSEPGIKVSMNVISATEKLKDTEISPEPVKDGDRWVVLWRKLTMKPVERSMEQETGSIKQMLLHARTDAKIKATIAALRQDHLTDYAPDLVDLFEVGPQGDLTPVRRPGALPTGKRLPVNPVPAPSSLR